MAEGKRKKGRVLKDDLSCNVVFYRVGDRVKTTELSMVQGGRRTLSL